MGPGVPPLNIETLTESNPPKWQIPRSGVGHTLSSLGLLLLLALEADLLREGLREECPLSS